VVALIEQDLIRAARLRHALGLTTGQSLSSALRFRDKILMKQVLSGAGLRVPTFAAADSAVDVLQFVHTHGLPVVVKPRAGHSSIGAVVLRDEEGLKRWVQALSASCCESGGVDRPLGLDVERFVPGQMYHIDGLVLNGRRPSALPHTMCCVNVVCCVLRCVKVR
jgi:biotin carboxylase